MKLYLPMKRVWFDLTAQGIKTEDYREISPYWINRLTLKFRQMQPDELEKLSDPGFRDSILGISLKSFDSIVEHIYGHVEPIEYEFKGVTIGYGREEWGAEKGVKYFVIHLGNKIA